MGRTVFVPRACLESGSGLIFGIESSMVSQDFYACALLLSHSRHCHGTDKAPLSIDSLNSIHELTCLGVWDESDNTFLETAHDQESHSVFVVFDEKALVRSKVLSSSCSPALVGDSNDALVWLYSIFGAESRFHDLLQLRVESPSDSGASDGTTKTTTTTTTTIPVTTNLLPAKQTPSNRSKTSINYSASGVEWERSDKTISEGADSNCDASGSSFSSSSSALMLFLDKSRRHSTLCRQLFLKWRSWRWIFSHFRSDSESIGGKIVDSNPSRNMNNKDDDEEDDDNPDGGSMARSSLEKDANQSHGEASENHDVSESALSPDIVHPRPSENNLSCSSNNSHNNSHNYNSNDSQRSVFLFGNLLGISIVDVVLGLAFSAVLLFLASGKSISCDWIVSTSKLIAFQLRRLVVWLQGVPAGLKLNKELSLFMGNFFFYHIHLWLGYLSFIEPLLGLFTAAIPLLGLFGGFSTQVSLFIDILACLSLHVYCFYVYASRVFYFLFRGFSSLFRLFRGKKKNPLRNRIDSCQFDFAQLFLGTLMFTILLFLFPTVFLYYVVFTALRILTLVVRFGLHCVVSVINHSPLYGLGLRLLATPCTANGIELDVLSSMRSRNAGNKTGAVFQLNLRQASCGDILRLCHHEIDRFYCEEIEGNERRSTSDKGGRTEPTERETRNLSSWLKESAGKLCRGELIEAWA